MKIFTLTLSPIPVALLSKTGQFFYDLNILSSEKSWWYQGTQVRPIQSRIQRAQQNKTLAAIAEINWPDERDSQMLLAKELAINEEMKLEVHPSPHPRNPKIERLGR